LSEPPQERPFGSTRLLGRFVVAVQVEFTEIIVGARVVSIGAADGAGEHGAAKIVVACVPKLVQLGFFEVVCLDPLLETRKSRYPPVRAVVEILIAIIVSTVRQRARSL
jgi:hypothetical protein